MLKEILTSKRCWIILLISTAFTVFLTYPFSTKQFSTKTYAGTDTNINAPPKALWNPYTGSWYITNDTVGTLQSDLYPAVVRVRFHSAGGSVTWFRFRFKWNSDRDSLLNADNVGYNYPPGFSFDTTRLGTNNQFQVTGVGGSAVLDSANTIFVLKFKVKCMTDGEQGDTITMDTTDATGQNFFTIGGANYRPANKREGKVTIPLLTLSSKPGKDTVIIDSTFLEPILYTTNFDAYDGFRDTFIIDSVKLEYKGVINNGATILATLVDSVSSGGGTIMVKTNNVIPAGDNNDLLLTLKLKNKMTANKQWAKVKVKYSKFRQHPNCSQAFAEQTTLQTDSVYTLYDATASIENKTTAQNKKDSLQVFLKNNFKAWMNSSANQDQVASLRIDTAWNGRATFKEHRDITANAWYWNEILARYGVRFKESASQSSNDIPISANPVTIFRMIDTTSNKDTTINVIFRVFNDSLTDNQFTDWVKNNPPTTPNITIRPTTTTDPSNTLVLVNGSITISTPGGGGSCPFLYVWNANGFEEDNSILTQTEYSPREQNVTDYYQIQKPLVAKDNQYHLQLRELTDEKSFIDKIELLTVDHPQEKRIAVTREGKILYTDEGLSPISALDDQGEEHIDKLTARDGVRYSSDKAGHLILTYKFSDKTWRGPMVLGGDEGPKWHQGPGPGGRVSPDNPRELKLYLIKTEIEDINGKWVELAQAPPRDNFSVHHWLVDQNQIPLGTTFKVRISWPKRYSADEIKFYFVSDQSPVANTIYLTAAFHSSSSSSSVMKLLSAEDLQFATISKGERLDLFFPVAGLPLPEGYTRDFIVKASGYYIPYIPEPTASIPDRFELKNNYPNPFNAVTEIQYALPEPSEVNLSVYNIMGQKVRTLAEGRQSAGVHKVTWDGKNEKGETVASGVYFYSIKAGTYIETKKMTLLK